MSKIVLGVVTLLLPVLLSASYVVNNDLRLNVDAIVMVDNIGHELEELTGVQALVVATDESLERGASAYEFIQPYVDETKEQVFLFLAPESRRIHVLSFNEQLDEEIDKSRVTSFAIGVVTSKDRNNEIDKLNIGVVQAYSELADQVGDIKGVVLANTIPNTTQNTINILRVIVWTGTILLFYGMFVRPYLRKRAKKKSEEEDSTNV